MMTWLMMTNGKNKAQSIVEYSVFIALFLVALVGIQIYLKRSIQGYIHNYTNSIGNGIQFSKAFSNYSQITQSSSKVEETITPTGERTVTLLDEPEINNNGSYVDSFSDKKLTEEDLFE